MLIKTALELRQFKVFVVCDKNLKNLTPERIQKMRKEAFNVYNNWNKTGKVSIN